MSQLQTEILRETLTRKMKSMGFDVDLSNVTIDVPKEDDEPACLCDIDCGYDIVIIIKDEPEDGK